MTNEANIGQEIATIDVTFPSTVVEPSELPAYTPFGSPSPYSATAYRYCFNSTTDGFGKYA
jgi:hypothetical protein